MGEVNCTKVLYRADRDQPVARCDHCNEQVGIKAAHCRWCGAVFHSTTKATPVNEVKRCDWAEKSRLEREYHDREWGIPVHDDKKLFKMLMLEGQQAGLSWTTILSKMDTLCAAYDDFDPAVLIEYDDVKIEALLQDDGIIKNRLKVNAVVSNAKAYFKLCGEFGSLDHYLWSFVNHQPITNAWTRIEEVPSSTSISDAISKDLKKWGFKFVGTTTIYAFMQAVGMVNDHLTSCAFYNRSI